MTAKQARRAAKILRDLMQSLTITDYNLRRECFTLAKALDEFADKEAFDASTDSSSRFIG